MSGLDETYLRQRLDSRRMRANMALASELRRYGSGFGLWVRWSGDTCVLVIGGRGFEIGKESDDLEALVAMAREVLAAVVA